MLPNCSLFIFQSGSNRWRCISVVSDRNSFVYSLNSYEPSLQCSGRPIRTKTVGLFIRLNANEIDFSHKTIDYHKDMPQLQLT